MRPRLLCACVLAGLLPALQGGIAPAHADPDEAWLLRAQLPDELRPLLVLILDRSAAMNATVEVREPYDSLRTYGDGLAADRRCDPGRVYLRRGPGPAPDCSEQTGLEFQPVAGTRGLQCHAAIEPLARLGVYVAARAAQWTSAGADGYWSALDAASAQAAECSADRGRHGATAGTWYASHGTAGPWSAHAADEIAWQLAPFADPYIFYAGNYLNYLRSAIPAVRRSLGDIAAAELATVLGASDELEVAVALTGDDDGGFVAVAPAGSASVAARLSGFLRAAASGGAPLAEALSEVAAWLTGSGVRFGDDERADPDAFVAGAGGRYRSPFTHACRPVTLAYLTAGQASNDESAAGAAMSLPGFAEAPDTCDPHCLATLAGWLSTADLRGDLPGRQSASIGWIAPMTASTELPAGSAGTIGRFEDPLSFLDLIARSLRHDAAVAAGPGLSAAGLIRATDASHAPSVVFGLSAPRIGRRWHGNLLRYALQAPQSPLAPPLVVDRDGEPAIDAVSALPRPASRSLWSDAPDSNLLAGAAAGRLPVATERRLFSDIASDRLDDPANRLEPGNPRLDRSMFGLRESDAETPDELLDWLAGERKLGDPGSQPPVTVEYPDAGRQLVFVATQDGMLHAFDADDGTELWAWLPRALLPRLVELMRDRPSTMRDHGIDGPLVLHRLDADGDGRIEVESGEHLWLLFGLGRGGNGYHALDISAPLEPRLLWSLSLPAAAPVESWAPPVVSRLAIEDSGQSEGHWVVLLSGGYSRGFDSTAARPTGAGNDLYLVDAQSGEILWRASGADAPEVQLTVPGFDASLPSAPRALDRDGDGRLDQAYLLDVRGRLWRFDFEDGHLAPDLASVRLLARLGGGDRKFYGSPDVSLIRRNGRHEIAVAAGSGWLSRPRDMAIEDRVYVVFDADSGPAAPPLEDDELHDASTGNPAPPTATGWYLRLDRHGAGEKSVGSTVTFDHVLRFQTYQPLPAAGDAPCGPPRDLRRLYARDIRTSLPHTVVLETEDDEPVEIAGAGLPVAMRFAFPGRWESPCTGCSTRPFAIAGATIFDGAYAGDPVRTSWRKLPPPPDSR